MCMIFLWILFSVILIFVNDIYDYNLKYVAPRLFRLAMCLIVGFALSAWLYLAWKVIIVVLIAFILVVLFDKFIVRCRKELYKKIINILNNQFKD